MELFQRDLEGMVSYHHYIKQYLQILFILRKDLNDKNKYDDIRKML